MNKSRLNTMIDKNKIQIVLHSPKTKKYGLRALIVFIVVGVLGFFVLPPIFKSILIEQLSKTLHRPVVVRSLSINPYALSMNLEGVVIKERVGSEVFVSFDNLYLNIESASFLRGGLVIGEIRLVNPTLRVVRLEDKGYNFSDLVDEFAAKPASNEPSTSFSLNNIQISGGTIEFDDQFVAEKHLVSAINLTLPFVSNMAYATETFVEPSFTAQVNGAPLVIKGKSKPFASTLETEVALDLADLSLANYLDYSPIKLPIKMTSGALDTQLKLLFKQEKNKSATLLLSGAVAIKNLKVDDSSDAPLVSFKRVDVSIGSADLLSRKFLFDRFSIDSPEIHARISQQGKLNWIGLFLQDSAPSKQTAKNAEALSPTKASSAVKWTLGEVKVVAGALSLVDESKEKAFSGRIDRLNFDATNLSSDPAQTAKLAASFTFNHKGNFVIDGNAKLFPLDADLNLAIKSLDLLPLQPYFSEKLNIAVTRGQLSLSGAMQLRQVVSDKLKESVGIAGGFSGQADVVDFYAVDKLNSAEFLRWKSLHFGNLDMRLNPDSISIDEIALSDFFSRVIVSPEGELNLMQIVRNEDTKLTAVVPTATDHVVSDGKARVPVVPSEQQNKPVMPVKIAKITLQGGNIRFTDNFVKPNYTANLKQIGGRVTGLSTQAGSVASLEFRGRYENVAPLLVTAKINPLSNKPYLDLQGEIKGIELTSFSSYAGKYAGYAIDKGKLSLSVNYKIENDQLEAENRVFLDQLTFGNPVESPDATKLPVTLAVALLKNRRGEIDLNLPISGSLNDPEFSIGGVVVKIIVNLFAKAVTSPFALLGAVFGGGEELSNVEFDYGRAAISPSSEKRLENLAKALIERPALRLEISGQVDSESDREGLKRARLDHKVRAMKREDLTKKSVESGSAETVEVSSQEFQALLERVYRAEKFPKPRNMIGMVKSLPVEEMEKLILANSIIDDDDLRQLGEQRARNVQNWLVEHHVPVERIFLLPVKVSEAGKSAPSETTTKASRVDFSLK